MPAEDFICPVCGTEVPAGAASCPECGSDENTGWSDKTIYDGTGIEEPEDYDYEEHMARETGKSRLPVWVKILAVVGLVALLWFFFVATRH